MLTQARIGILEFKRSLGSDPTVKESLDLAEKRNVLRVKAEQWQRKADKYIPTSAEQDVADGGAGRPPEAPPTRHALTSDADNPFTSTRVTSADPGATLSPEIDVLSLPSSLGVYQCEQLGIGHLAEDELRLRKGQAEDTLQELRLLLGEKALVFRTLVRESANSQAGKTRSQTAVRAVQDKVKLQHRIYNSCRQAMIALGADEDVLQQYQQMTAEQLVIHTKLLDPSEHHTRHEHLPWFWKLHLSLSPADTNHLNECKSHFCTSTSGSDFVIIQFIGSNGYVSVPRPFAPWNRL